MSPRSRAGQNFWVRNFFFLNEKLLLFFHKENLPEKLYCLGWGVIFYFPVFCQNWRFQNIRVWFFSLSLSSFFPLFLSAAKYNRLNQGLGVFSLCFSFHFPFATFQNFLNTGQIADRGAKGQIKLTFSKIGAVPGALVIHLSCLLSLAHKLGSQGMKRFSLMEIFCVSIGVSGWNWMALCIGGETKWSLLALNSVKSLEI